MYSKSLLLVCLLCSLIGCRKNNCEEAPQPPPPEDDIPAVKLRTMSVSRLPDPYYHFTYNDSGYITRVNHASGLIFYDLSYANKRIRQILVNKDIAADINKDRLDYEYANGQPTVVRVTNKQGLLYRRCRLSYAPSRQLQQLTWEINPGSGFVTEQTLQFSYYADSNLKEIAYHDFPVGPVAENTYADHFEEYDDGTNVDGFTWLHTPRHHPVLIPAVVLQRNNPRRVYRTGERTVTYDARYQYFYDGTNRTLIKFGEAIVKEINGDTSQFHSATTYTYY